MVRKTILLISFLVGIAGLVGFAQSVNAASLNAGPLTVTYDGDGPIFSELDISPGATFTKDITVTNIGTASHSFALATKNVTGDMASELYLSPIGATENWTMSVYELSQLPTESQTVFSSIAPNATDTFTLKAEFDQNAQDQRQKLTFDLVFGTQEAEPALAVVPAGRLLAALAPAVGSPTPAPSPSPSVSASPSPEVKGAQTESGSNGLKWQFLLIVPAAALLAIAALPATIEAAILVPALSGAAAAFLAQNYSGTLKPWVFWLILIIEIIVFFIIKYYRYLRRLALAAVKDVEKEAKKIKKEIKKDLKIK